MGEGSVPTRLKTTEQTSVTAVGNQVCKDKVFVFFNQLSLFFLPLINVTAVFSTLASFYLKKKKKSPLAGLCEDAILLKVAI